MFVLYSESQQANIEYAQTNFPCAWALHDEDVWQQSDVDKWSRAHSDLPFPHGVGSLKKPHVHVVCKFPDRDFHAETPNSKWVTDIFYIQAKRGVLYLSMIRDLYDTALLPTRLQRNKR